MLVPWRVSFRDVLTLSLSDQVVVSSIFHFYPWGNDPNWTIIFFKLLGSTPNLVSLTKWRSSISFSQEPWRDFRPGYVRRNDGAYELQVRFQTWPQLKKHIPRTGSMARTVYFCLHFGWYLKICGKCRWIYLAWILWVRLARGLIWRITSLKINVDTNKNDGLENAARFKYSYFRCLCPFLGCVLVSGIWADLLNGCFILLILTL